MDLAHILNAQYWGWSLRSIQPQWWWTNLNSAGILLILITILKYTLTLARLLNKMHNMSPMTSVNYEVAYILQESDLVCVVNKCVDVILCRRRHCGKNGLRWTLMMKLVDFVTNLLYTDHLMSWLAISVIEFRTQSNVSYSCNVVVAAILGSKKKLMQGFYGCYRLHLVAWVVVVHMI